MESLVLSSPGSTARSDADRRESQRNPCACTSKLASTGGSRSSAARQKTPRSCAHDAVCTFTLSSPARIAITALHVCGRSTSMTSSPAIERRGAAVPCAQPG